MVLMRKLFGFVMENSNSKNNVNRKMPTKVVDGLTSGEPTTTKVVGPTPFTEFVIDTNAPI